MQCLHWYSTRPCNLVLWLENVTFKKSRTVFMYWDSALPYWKIFCSWAPMECFQIQIYIMFSVSEDMFLILHCDKNLQTDLPVSLSCHTDHNVMFFFPLFFFSLSLPVWIFTAVRFIIMYNTRYFFWLYTMKWIELGKKKSCGAKEINGWFNSRRLANIQF